MCKELGVVRELKLRGPASSLVHPQSNVYRGGYEITLCSLPQSQNRELYDSRENKVNLYAAQVAVDN